MTLHTPHHPAMSKTTERAVGATIMLAAVVVLLLLMLAL